MRTLLGVLLLLVCVLLPLSAHGEDARGKRIEDANGNAATGDAATGDAATGDAATGDAADAASVTYDYIVVGAGATGGVIATRLAKTSAHYQVLVLDGGIPSQTSVGGTDYVAASYSFDSEGNAIYNKPLTRYDVPAFCYSAAADFPGSPTPWYPFDSTLGPLKAFSRVIGGNSVHNYMVWSRISPVSLNAWNLTNWSYSDVLPYFKKIEDVRGTYLANNPAYHGFNGPIEITEAQVPDPIGKAFVQSCARTGYGIADDFNAPGNYIGCNAPTFNINRRGIRGGAVNQYLAPTLKTNSNLVLKSSAPVTKLIIDTSCNPPKVTGVKYEINNVSYSAYARKEVILSAGANGSPKILLLSGIGPRKQLTSFGIPVIADLPVGLNMSTHPIIFTYYDYNATGVNGYGLSSSGVEYAINGTGVFASISVPAMAQLKSDSSQPDFDLHVQVALAGGVHQVSLLALRLKFQRDLQLKLQSADPHVAPYLVFNPFTRNEDVVALAKSIKILREIAASPPLNTFITRETDPGPAYQTQAQLEGWVRNGGGIPILTHLHGGAPLGNAGDAKAVLDYRARVKGVANLRVADSSIIPAAIVALPTHNLIAFAEKIADYIIADA